MEKFQSGAGASYPTGLDSTNSSSVMPIPGTTAQNIRVADDAPPSTAKKPLGEITTLLDLTNRDLQENDLFPLNTDITWFTRDTERRILAFTPSIQEIPLRGPGAFGQRFSFDVGSLLVGDLLFGTALQIRLGHWLDLQTQLLLEAGKITYDNSGTAWEYANSLGTAIIQQAELEIDGKTVETIDGDFINVFSTLFADYNQQIGLAYDHHGRLPRATLMAEQAPRLFPTEGGTLNCILPFFYMRSQRKDSLPMIAIREGLVKIHITLRPFEECVRQLRGYRDSCTATPLATTIGFHEGATARPVDTVANPPGFRFIQLLTQGAIVNGAFRQRMLRSPFEILHREVQTFYFEEPLKYTVGSVQDAVRIQLPLEANHPLEEIIWFVRRKGVSDNNAWTNYSSVLDAEWNPRAVKPMLQKAMIQANGVTICNADELYYRQLISSAHKGGMAAMSSFIYGYPFSKHPGEHQPSGSFNASRVTLRLVLDVKAPPGALWEVKVFCIGMNWMRFENGLANPMFED